MKLFIDFYNSDDGPFIYANLAITNLYPRIIKK